MAPRDTLMVGFAAVWGGVVWLILIWSGTVLVTDRCSPTERTERSSISRIRPVGVYLTIGEADGLGDYVDAVPGPFPLSPTSRSRSAQLSSEYLRAADADSRCA
jgi:hypothetical protein